MTLSADLSKNVITVYYVKDESQTKATSYTVKHVVDGAERTADTKTYNSTAWIGEANPTIAIEEGSLAQKSYEGYKFDSMSVAEGTKEVASGTTITLTYVPRTDLSYTVNYYLQGTTVKVADSKKIDDQTFGTEVTEEAIDISGYSKVAPTSQTISIGVEGNEINFYYTRNAEPARYANYHVNRYLQNTDDNGYTLISSEELSGLVDAEATATAGAMEGFTFNAAASNLTDVIAADGSLVLNLYYDRNTYTVSYAYAGDVPAGAPAVPASATYRYGQTVAIAAAPAVAGYTFSGWTRDRALATGFQMPDSDVTLTGTWTQVTTVVPEQPTNPVVPTNPVTPTPTPTPATPATPGDARHSGGCYARCCRSRRNACCGCYPGHRDAGSGCDGDHR